MLLVARLVFVEAARRRLALIAALLTTVGIGLSAWGFNRLAAAAGPEPSLALAGTVAAIVIMMSFMFTNVLALGAALIGATTLGSEIENGTLLSIAPRPIRRVEILAGKWLGAFGVLAVFGACSIGLEMLVVRIETGYLPPHPWLALGFLLAALALVVACAMTFSTRLAPLTAAIATVVLYGASWIDGVVHLVATALNNVSLSQATLAVGLLFPSDGLWRGVLYALEPVAIRAAGLTGAGNAGPFAVTGPPTAAFLTWCALWFAAIAWAGAASFRARDL